MLVLFATSAADFKELEEKSGKLHKIGAEKPYTGKVEIYDSSKNTAYNCGLYNGTANGMMNGSLRYGKFEEKKYNDPVIVDYFVESHGRIDCYGRNEVSRE